MKRYTPYYAGIDKITAAKVEALYPVLDRLLQDFESYCSKLDIYEPAEGMKFLAFKSFCSTMQKRALEITEQIVEDRDE